ncbi:MAG: ACT domain-containing protein [Mangrovibacterium sp.]
MIQQVSVFLENKAGHVERVSQVLRRERINVRSITLTHTAGGWGILNLLVDQPEEAARFLSEAGLSATLRRVFVFGMEDQPGGLDEVLHKVARAGVNIINAYGRVIRRGELALLVIDVDDYDTALPLLLKAGLQPLDDETAYDR